VESLAMTRFEARTRRCHDCEEAPRSALAAARHGRRSATCYPSADRRGADVASSLAQVVTRSSAVSVRPIELVRRLDAAVESERRALDVSIGCPVLEAVFVPK
jgi:hypothetical protein